MKNKMEQHPTTRYGTVAQIFHWATAVLVLIAFIYGPGGSEQRIYAPAADFDRRLHETLGMSVFVLVVLRVLWRMFDTRPDPIPSPRWMELSAKALQGALYLLMFALPITAVTGAWLEGHPVTLLGGVQLAPLLGLSHAAGARLADLHGWLGDAILWLAGLHAVAAIYHHIVLKDGVLVAMLPHRFAPRRSNAR